MLSVIAGEVYEHKSNLGVIAFYAFATVVEGSKSEFEAYYSASKFVIRVGGYQGEGSCCMPHLVEHWGEDDGNIFEEVSPAVFSTECIVLEDVVASHVNIELVTFLPRLLQ